MKLSAPPPPPPPPPEPPAPNSDGGDPAAAPPVPTPETPNTATQPATWPQWFATADVALAALAVGLAFLLASFVARNTDVWVHLAAGKRLLAGEYRLGSDPFSYAAADRTWVNHSWLWDTGAYLLYRGNGAALVVVKALAVAAAAVLLLAIRRPPFSLWPWVLCLVLAALAAAPRLGLGPQVASVLFLALTLFLVFRLPSPPGSWRLPLWVGATFWVWANCDQWFFLGPLAVALLLVGELIQQRLAKPAAAADPPLKLPDTGTLARALLVGIVACMLNPHHVRVWDLPIELMGSDAVAADAGLRELFLSAFDTAYRENPRLGNNLNGFVYAVLLVGGSLVLAVGTGRAGLAQAALWIGFALVSLRTVAAIPFFAVVAVPLVAARLSLFTAKLELGTRAETRTRVLLTAGAAGRVCGILVLAGLCAAAWPGWLQPTPFNPADVARVAWAVETDPSLVRAAETVGRWREDGRLPPEVRGVSLHVGVANCMAWFAPQEKVLLNGRYTHHREELAALGALRLALGVRGDEGLVPDAVGKIFRRYEASYLLVFDRYPRFTPGRLADQLASDADHWSEWYTDGRAQVFGWREGKAGPPWFDRLRLDPAVVAFGPGVDRLPPGRVEPIPPPRSWADEFVRSPRPAPPEADEALGWLDYKATVTRAHQLRQGVGQQLAAVTPLPQGASLHQFVMQRLLETNQFPSPAARPADFLAPPVLAVRAARRAIAANPDHPDGYYALGRALADPNLRLSDAERNIGIITAYRQCLSRFPPPDEFRRQVEQYGRNVYAAMPSNLALTLVAIYLNPAPPQRGQSLGTPRGFSIELPVLSLLAGTPVQGPQGQPTQVPALLPLDLVRALLIQANEYAAVEMVRVDAEQRADQLKQLTAFQKAVEDRLRGELKRYEDAEAAAGGKLADKYVLARRHHLVDKALSLLKGKDVDLVKEFGPHGPVVALQMIALELCVGRLEDAAADIAALKEAFEERARKGDTDDRFRQQRDLLRGLELHKLNLEGDYAAAGKLLEDVEGGSVGTERILAEFQKLQFDPRAFSAVRGAWPAVPMLGAASPLEALALLGAGSVQAGKYDSYRGGLRQQMADDAEFFFRRGFLSLLEGDVEAAKVRFRQAKREPPPGWNLPAVQHGPAAEYLKLIEGAERKP